MKQKHLFLLILIIVVSVQLVLGQNQSRIFDYPIKPGTKEWKSLNSYEDRLNVYNIPDELLNNMNTSDLVQTCLDYPEFRLIMTRNSLQQGYDYLTTIFNGFRELEKRKDAGIELINAYIQLNPADITNYNTPVERGGFAFKIKYIEILLAQKPILANLNKESKKNLIDKSLSNYGIIEKMPDQYATFGLMTPALILGRLLDTNNQQEFVTMKSKDDNLRGFINNGDIGDIQMLTDIISFSKTYLKQIENE